MPRAIWSGTITFGLIAIPVKLHPAIGRTDKVDLHLLHEKDGERIHNERRCEAGHKVDWDDLVRGYEYTKGKWVTFTDEELEAIRTDSMHTVDVVTFVPSDEIDPMYYENTYHVSAEGPGAKAYGLLVDALESEGLVGISKVAIRDRERLAAVRVTDGRIVLNTMHWPDEIREPAAKPSKVQARDNERKMARQLVRQLRVRSVRTSSPTSTTRRSRRPSGARSRAKRSSSRRSAKSPRRWGISWRRSSAPSRRPTSAPRDAAKPAEMEGG